MKKKILVVDNNPVIVKFMTNLLVKKSYHVLTAEDGLSALEILKTYTPDVMFIDLIMPNIGGKKLCQIIRRMPRLKNAFIIILSAVAAEEETKYTEFGANACIAKGPFNSMSEHILTALNKWEMGNSKILSKEVIGRENIHYRTITKELLSSQKHFEIILESMSEGILELTSEARIVYANPVAISSLGRTEDKLLALDFTELFKESERKRIKKLLVSPDHSPQTISEDSPVSLNGKQFSMKILPIKEKGKEAIIIILNDISLRKKMEAQLRQAQKMEAIGTLAGGIAHDFNNLLMGIQGYTSLMLIQIDPTHQHFEYLKGIENSVQRGADLTRQLLGFARGGKYDVKLTNLNEIIKKSADMFGRTTKEITIREKYEQNLWAVEVDRGQIEQVLLNLYVNAWQAMPGGGDLYLQTENVTLDESYVKPFKIEPGKYAKISITDTGVGMDEQTKERIFEPFFTTKEMGRGTGLGLASVYGIIKNHGGFINVYSEKGEGTTFTIYLPASEKEVIKEKVLSDKILKGSETILLVDDEEMILNVGQGILKSMGYKVLIARSGKEAIEVYKKNQDKIDMVILDMIMPEVSGGKTYDRIKEINPQVKVLLSSGYSIEGQATEILERGCNGFIQKPFSIIDLSRSIGKVLDKNKAKSV